MIKNIGEIATNIVENNLKEFSEAEETKKLFSENESYLKLVMGISAKITAEILYEYDKLRFPDTSSN